MLEVYLGLAIESEIETIETYSFWKCAMSRLPDFEAWAIFAKVAEMGAFARAAGELGLSKATVSKAVSRLETRMGATLFHRTSRRLSLTESGRTALERASRILAEGEAIEAEAAAQSSEPRGLVRLATPMSFGLRHVGPILPEFLSLYPQITLDLSLSDEKVDLVAEGFDLGVRIGVLPDSSLLARRLCGVKLALVGAPSYFEQHGTPQHPRDLVWHRALTYTYALTPNIWRFGHQMLGEQSVSVSGLLKVNNSDAMLPTLKAGMGLALLPEFLVWPELADGSLRAVMGEWQSMEIGLHLVSPPGRSRPARVRVLSDFLAERLASAAWAQPD